ncbi:MAG: hypothetical protein ACE5OZ_08900 [Candidatus Heimdallarchaeota archaeon]
MPKKRSQASRKTSKKTKEEVEGEIWATPCLICDSLDRCGVGQQVSPISCSNINHWILLKGLPPEQELKPEN